MIRPLSSGVKHLFSGNIQKHVGYFPIDFFSVPTNLPTNHSLLACVWLFLCGRVSFVVEGRRCVLFDAYATLSRGRIWMPWCTQMHVDRLLHVCSVGRLLLVCFGAVCEGVVLTIIIALCYGKWPSTVLHNNMPLQSTLAPFVV